MAQRYIPEISNGDKRVLMIDGKPYPKALVRLPSPNDFRGNLSAGATGMGAELTTRDIWICEQLGPMLSKKGLFFAGLDIIGDYLSEINVTSPTCVREIEAAFNVNICAEILDRLKDKITDR
jgi:glutathione synthase